MRSEFHDPIEYELAKEKAEGLARTEQRLLAALDAFREVESADAADPLRSAQRARRLWRLVEVVSSYVVQREACGLNDADYVLRFHRIPREVVARIGAKPPIELT